VIARTLRWVTLLAATLATTAAWADPPRPAPAPTVGTATATAARAAPRPAATGAPAPEGVVNINTATVEELVRVPGIGPARAAAIVQLRERAHRFNHAEDLLRVRGIGRVGAPRRGGRVAPHPPSEYGALYSRVQGPAPTERTRRGR